MKNAYFGDRCGIVLTVVVPKTFVNMILFLIRPRDPTKVAEKGA